MNGFLDALGLPDSESWKSYLPAAWTKRAPVVPVLRFSGAIGVVTPLRPGLSLATSAAAIEKAFSMRGAKAVAIQINSPGGSAVQSMLIYKRVRALAAEKDLKVYVFAEDVAASGGYLLALAGDEIYADPSSIVGSIGVITATFGLNEMIAKIGVRRRVYTAGESKDTLDPFLPPRSPRTWSGSRRSSATCIRPSSSSSRRAGARSSTRPTSISSRASSGPARNRSNLASSTGSPTSAPRCARFTAMRCVSSW